jgi:hypothetical protein
VMIEKTLSFLFQLAAGKLGCSRVHPDFLLAARERAACAVFC